MVKYIHTNIVAKDWRKLAEFYINVFNCKPLLPERDLSGEKIELATGIKNASLKGIHLLLPGYNEEEPTLEIFEYNKPEKSSKQINSNGFAHIAFLVNDMDHYLNKLTQNGGQQIGEVTKLDIKNVGQLSFVYCKDPEGNFVEIQTNPLTFSK